MVRRYYIYPHAPRLRLSGGDHGLVQPLCPLLEALYDIRETAFCTEALQEALEHPSPEIFNSDQGVQFTSQEFTNILHSNGIKISMDGHGRAYDNIFVVRLLRTVKYEEVYLHEYRTVSEARLLLSDYFHFYNTERIHESLGYLTPHEVYYGEEALSAKTEQASYSMHLKQPCLLS